MVTSGKNKKSVVIFYLFVREIIMLLHVIAEGDLIYPSKIETSPKKKSQDKSQITSLCIARHIGSMW